MGIAVLASTVMDLEIDCRKRCGKREAVSLWCFCSGGERASPEGFGKAPSGSVPTSCMGTCWRQHSCLSLAMLLTFTYRYSKEKPGFF